ADPRPEGLAELCWPARGVALPERQPSWLSRGRAHDDAVPGDLLDAPRARAERDGVSGSRLLDHLLVELTDTSPAPILPSDDDGEQPAVRDRPARGHGEPLGSRPPRELVGAPVPHDPGA